MNRAFSKLKENLRKKDLPEHFLETYGQDEYRAQGGLLKEWPEAEELESLERVTRSLPFSYSDIPMSNELSR